MKTKVPTFLLIATLVCITIYIGVFIGRATSRNITALPDAPNDSYTNSASFSLDLNQATIDDLLRLPGMDRQLAENIIAYREKFGSFVLVGEVRRIEGMTDQIYNLIKEYLTVSP